MNITSKTEYALRALYEVICSSTGKPVTRKQIAESQGISEHFLEKIFIGLQKREIIRSVRGPGGGFVLNRTPDEISLWDVYLAVDNPGYRDDTCYQKSANGCVQEPQCKVKHIWYKFGKTLKETMTGITMSEIAG